jgi:flagellar motor protein MotB
MARRKRTPVSSLDLFLDTICNAFGGIMFISILISILIQMRGNEPESTDTRAELTEIQALQKQTELADLHRQIEIVSQSISDRERLLLNEDTVQARELQSQRLTLRQQLETLQKQQQSLLGQSAKRNEEIQSIEQEIREIEKRLQEAKLAVAERSKEVNDALDSAETTTTMPKVSSTSKGNLLFGMRYGKLYLLSSVDNRSSDGVNSEHVTAIPTLQGVRVSIRKDAGWLLSSDEAKSELEQVMRRNPSTSTFFTIAVWPDSFQQFLDWKQMLVREGYDYDLRPVDDLESLVIGKGSSAATVQ